MTTKTFLESSKSGKRYEIVSLDTKTGMITLKGEHNAPFTEPYDKARFKEMGYKPVVVEVED